MFSRFISSNSLIIPHKINFNIVSLISGMYIYFFNDTCSRPVSYAFYLCLLCVCVRARVCDDLKWPCVGWPLKWPRLTCVVLTRDESWWPWTCVWWAVSVMANERTMGCLFSYSYFPSFSFFLHFSIFPVYFFFLFYLFSCFIFFSRHLSSPFSFSYLFFFFNYSIFSFRLFSSLLIPFSCFLILVFINILAMPQIHNSNFSSFFSLRSFILSFFVSREKKSGKFDKDSTSIILSFLYLFIFLTFSLFILHLFCGRIFFLFFLLLPLLKFCLFFFFSFLNILFFYIYASSFLCC